MTHRAMAGGTGANRPADAAARSVFTGVAALLSLHAALRMARDIFPAFVVSQKGLVWIQALAVFFIVLYEIGIPALLQAACRGRDLALLRPLRHLCGLWAAAVFGWVCYRYAKSCQADLEDGACAAAVQYLDKWNKHLHTSIRIWQGKAEWMGLALAFWTLVVFLGVLAAALVFHRRALLLLFPSAVLALELLIGYIPRWKSMSLLFAALLFVQADGGGAKRADLIPDVNPHRHRGFRWYLYGIPAVCLTAAAAGLLIAGSMLTDATQGWLMERSGQVQAFQQRTEKNLAQIWRGQFLQKTEGVNNQKPQYTRKEMLRVTASQCPSEDVLLKGFCGTDYGEEGWTCDTQAFTDACAQAGYDRKLAADELFGAKYDLLLHGANRIAWYYTYGGGFVSIGSGEHRQAAYTVEHTGVRSQYAFAPYVVRGAGNVLDSYVGDATVRKRRGQSVFSYEGWRRFSGSVDLVRMAAADSKGVFKWYDKFVKTAYLTTSDRIPALDEYMNQYMTDQENWDAAAGIITSKKQTMQIRNWLTILYLNQDAATYEQERASSGQEADVNDAAWYNKNRMKTAQALREMLQHNQTYSLDLEPLAQGADPIWYFLMKSRKGYCVHFASAAVLLLRELGVPARYASGYVARASDFKQEGDVYVASVKDSSAHAWAEIYLDQIGWVPVDVTPADAGTFEQGLSNADAETQIQDKDQTPTRTDTDDTQTDTDDTRTDTDDTSTDDTQEQADTGSTPAAADLAKTKWTAFWAALLAAAALGLAWRASAAWRVVVEREVRAGKYGAAVRRANRRIYRRMRFYRKIPKQDLSDAQYEHALMLAWQQIPQEDWKRFMEIAKKAAFAREGEVSRQEAEFCLRIYQNLRKKVNC